MFINLNEIPAEGKSFRWNSKTAELNEILSDLLDGSDYSAEFIIRPLSTEGTFEMQGFIRTVVPEQCSRCGLDFKLNLDELFKEILIPEQNLPRNGKFAKPNHVSDQTNDTLSAVEYQGNQFNMGEYLHEVVGLAIPFSPAPEISANGDCVACKISLKNQSFNYDEDFEKPESPFSALKNIKLN